MLAVAVPVVLAPRARAAPNKPVATTAGHHPPVWTGSPAPSAPPERRRWSTRAHASGRDADRRPETARTAPTVATADIVFSGNYATDHREDHRARGAGARASTACISTRSGKCEANSVAPTGGAPGDFNSAGGHFQVAGHTSHPASGDLSSLQVREDGSALLGDDHRRVHRRGSARPVPRRRSSSTRRRTTSPTSRRSAISRPTAPRHRTRPPWPPAMPVSGWRAVSYPARGLRPDCTASTSPFTAAAADRRRRVGVRARRPESRVTCANEAAASDRGDSARTTRGCTRNCCATPSKWSPASARTRVPERWRTCGGDARRPSGTIVREPQDGVVLRGHSSVREVVGGRA